MYAAGACVVLILVIMGVSLFNSFDRMKSVQSTLGILGKETAQEQKDKPEEKQKDAETVAASAEVTEGHAVDQSSEKKVDETESPAEVKKIRQQKNRKKRKRAELFPPERVREAKSSRCRRQAGKFRKM